MKNNFSYLKTNTRRILFAIITIMAIILSSCSSGSNTITKNEEESSAELALDESYDDIRNGARLRLTYNTESNSFIGVVENTTDNILKQVRVEVHLSNGIELGPTTPVDLKPGESVEINISATDEDFEKWTAHPEVGGSSGGEHDNADGDNEHGEEGDSN